MPLLAAAINLIACVAKAQAMNHGQPRGQGQGMISQVLMMSSMDAGRGRKLFASMGCVVCHSVNGVGGKDAPALDAPTMPTSMNPFEFAAKMWRGSEAMIALQREELGDPIEFTGQEFADIVGFDHDPDQQKRFSGSDIPPRIKDLMEHKQGEEEHVDKGVHGGKRSRP